MSNEELAIAILQGKKSDKRRIFELWNQVKGLLHKMAREYYNRHKESCARCGVELQDIDGSLRFLQNYIP